MTELKQTKTGKVLAFVEKSGSVGGKMKVLRKKRPGRVLAFVEKSTEREMYKTTEESMEESEPAVDSGEMGGTNEEKDSTVHAFSVFYVASKFSI